MARRQVRFKERLDAHRLIEEFMVLANVAAAEELERLRQPLLYRVHEEPSPDKIDALREVAQASGFTLAGSAEDRASEPALGAGRGQRIRRPAQYVHAAGDDPGLLRAAEPRAFRAGAALLCAFHLADPALFET